MPILNLNFTEISAEKKKPISGGKINVKKDAKIVSIERDNAKTSSMHAALRVGFDFSVIYEPEIGSINLKGTIIYLMESKAAEKLVKTWSKDKRIEDEKTLLTLINAVLLKSNIKSLSLAEELGLPPHFDLPRVKKIKS